MLVRGTLKRANIVTVPSSPVLAILTETGLREPDRLMRWSLGVETEMFSPAPTARRGGRPFTFIAVGSLIPVKGHRLLLESFALLRGDGAAEARLTIVGAGPRNRELHELVDHLGLMGYVDFLGDVPHDRLPELYGSADCFVIASWHEAQCMAALEAMSCGLPWISLPVGSLADVPSCEGDTPTGIRVGSRSAAELAKAMREMSSKPLHELAEWGQNARHVIEREFNLKVQTARLLDILGELELTSDSSRG